MNEYEILQKFFEFIDVIPNTLKDLRSEFKHFKSFYKLDLDDYAKKIIVKKTTGETFVDETIAYLLNPRVLYSTGTYTPYLLFNYDLLDFNKTLIVCESVASVPLLQTVFKTNNVTATFGSNISDRQYELLRPFKHIIFIPDNDEAGIGSLELSMEKLPQDIFVVPLEMKDDNINFKNHLETFFVDGMIRQLSAITYLSRMQNNLRRIL